VLTHSDRGNSDFCREPFVRADRRAAVGLGRKTISCFQGGHAIRGFLQLSQWGAGNNFAPCWDRTVRKKGMTAIEMSAAETPRF